MLFQCRSIEVDDPTEFGKVKYRFEFTSEMEDSRISLASDDHSEYELYQWYVLYLPKR